MNNITLSPNGRYAIIGVEGLYLIQFGVLASIGQPAIATISFTPGGIDGSGTIPLTANAMTTGSIVRKIGAQTYVGLYVHAADNNTTVTIPATTSFSNAYLTIARIGPYPG